MAAIIEQWDAGRGLSAVRCVCCQREYRFAPALTPEELQSKGYRPVYSDRRHQTEGRRIAWLCCHCRTGAGPVLRNP